MHDVVHSLAENKKPVFSSILRDSAKYTAFVSQNLFFYSSFFSFSIASIAADFLSSTEEFGLPNLFIISVCVSVQIVLFFVVYILQWAYTD